MRILAVLALTIAALVSDVRTGEAASDSVPGIGEPVQAGEWMLMHAKGSAGIRPPPVAMLRSGNDGALMLHCRRSPDGAVTVQPAVFTRTTLGRGHQPKRHTLLQFDDKVPASFLWSYGEKAGGPVRPEDARTIVESVRVTTQMRVDLVDYRLNHFTVNFSLVPEKTRIVVAEMLSGCRSASWGPSVSD